MQLKAGCDITVEATEPCPLVAMLRPRSGRAQWIQSESYLLEPRVEAEEYVDLYGNLCQRLVAPEGKLRIRSEAVVFTEEEAAVDRDAGLTQVSDLPEDVLTFLLPSRYCPSDKLMERAQRIAGDARPGYRQAERICNWIHENIQYQYGVSEATTDAAETLQQGAGVCRDFSHIGLSLCRGLRIPARMVVGYLHGLEPMDMHAWFEAYVGGRWYTFDATQDGPRGGRIVVAYGRDAADVAFISNYGPLTTQSMKVWVEEQG